MIRLWRPCPKLGLSVRAICALCRLVIYFLKFILADLNRIKAFFFRIQVEDLKKGISKPLQEMMLSSEDEDTSQSTISTASTSMQSQYGRGKNFDSQADDLEDDEDYEEDDDEDIS